MAAKPHKPKGMKTWSRVGKVENQPIVIAGTYTTSFGVLLSENHITCPIQELRKICEKQEVL